MADKTINTNKSCNTIADRKLNIVANKTINANKKPNTIVKK